MPEAAVASTKRIGPDGRCAHALEIRLSSRHKMTEGRRGSGMRDQQAGTTGVHPHFDQHGRRSHEKESVERGIDRLVEAQHHFYRGNSEYCYVLAGFRA